MIQIGVILVLSGTVGAMWRHYHNNNRMMKRSADKTVSHHATPQLVGKHATSTNTRVTFDDVNELNHYQKVAWYTVALSAAGSWFYPPARLLSLPLLGYNAYHLLRAIRNARESDQKSPMTVFEGISFTGTLISGNALLAATLLLFSFGARKFLLYAGNITNNVNSSGILNMRDIKVWVLREGSEIELSLSDLQGDDIVVLRAGDMIAFESKILEGYGQIRQFSLSKQMKTFYKEKGDSVYPFTYLDAGKIYVSAPR